MLNLFHIELPHALGTHGANHAMEKACEHYTQAYPKVNLTWNKPTPTTFAVSFFIGDASAVIQGEAMHSKIELTMEVEGADVPELLLKLLVQKEARKWL